MEGSLRGSRDLFGEEKGFIWMNLMLVISRERRYVSCRFFFQIYYQSIKIIENKIKFFIIIILILAMNGIRGNNYWSFSKGRSGFRLIKVVIHVTWIRLRTTREKVGNYRTKRWWPEFRMSLQSFLRMGHLILRNHREEVPTSVDRAGASCNLCQLLIRFWKGLQ